MKEWLENIKTVLEIITLSYGIYRMTKKDKKDDNEEK